MNLSLPKMFSVLELRFFRNDRFKLLINPLTNVMLNYSVRSWRPGRASTL